MNNVNIYDLGAIGMLNNKDYACCSLMRNKIYEMEIDAFNKTDDLGQSIFEAILGFMQ